MKIILILLHLVDGRTVEINPLQVTQLQEPRGESHPGRQLTKKISCVVSFADGKFVSVVETCAEVATKLREAGP